MLNRRDLIRLAGASAVATVPGRTASHPVSLFDGKTLKGWIQIENGDTSLTSNAIRDLPAFVHRLDTASDALSVFLRAQLTDAMKSDSAALRKQLNQTIAGDSIYGGDRFRGVTLSLAAQRLLRKRPRTRIETARLNMLLLNDAYPDHLVKASGPGWRVKDGAMASTGSGRGVIYTAKDYGRFRLTFAMRHISGNPDHQACVLIFCTRPRPDDVPLDALAGIQFQVPNGGRWDYRPNMNNNGGAEFTVLAKPGFDARAWSRVEIVADSDKGTARMAVAQPPDAKAVDVLDFKDPAAGKPGPIALQRHNAGLFDEYKDLEIVHDL